MWVSNIKNRYVVHVCELISTLECRMTLSFSSNDSYDLWGAHKYIYDVTKSLQKFLSASTITINRSEKHHFLLISDAKVEIMVYSLKYHSRGTFGTIAIDLRIV